MVRNAVKRSLTVEIPKYLLDQVNQRAQVNGRRRNQEFRYLVDLGIRYSSGSDPRVDIPGKQETPWVITTVAFDQELNEQLIHRSQSYQRSVGREFVRMSAFAIEEMARRDLSIISEMMSLQARSERTAPQTEAT